MRRRLVLPTVGLLMLAAGPSGSGHAQSRPEGPRPGATLTITGLDQAIEVLRGASGAALSRERAGLVTALSILSLAGRPEPGAAAGARSYRIEATEDGRVLVNGVDLAPLVRGFEAQTAPRR